MTLRLFHSPGACSLVSHIALAEAGAEFEAIRVTLAQGEHLRPEYLAINPHARVPALVTDKGVITENIAILNFVADCFGSDGSVPRGDSFETARCNELLGWFASSVHIAFAQIWRAGRFTDEESVHRAIQEGGRMAVGRYFEEIDGLCGKAWLVGDRFSAADSYALTFFRWGNRINLEMNRYPRLASLVERVLERPHVQNVLRAEGLSFDDFRAAAAAAS